jgi:ribosomal protein L40E
MGDRVADRGASTPDAQAQTDVSERALGRAVAFGLPVAAALTSLSLGLTFGVGPALLVLAGGAILGTISLLWASIRTLSGDAPLAESFSTLAGNAATSSGGAGERKRAALRALKDLDFEHSVGKIDDEDYSELVARYRGEAKALMREMDVEIEPLRERAEELAREYLAKRGLDRASEETTEEAVDPVDEEPVRARPADAADAPYAPSGKARATPRLGCSKCETANETDADFCKKCGTLLRQKCVSCNTQNEPDAAFCKKCGTAITTSSTKSPDATR